MLAREHIKSDAVYYRRLRDADKKLIALKDEHSKLQARYANEVVERTHVATEKRLRAIRPSAALEQWLHEQLRREIDAMHQNILYVVAAEYKRDQQRIMAQDESPADRLSAAMRQLSMRWIARFDALSNRLAEHFSKAVERRSTTALKRMLAEHGMSVKFQITPAMRDVMDATVKQSVALIRSIPQQYLGQVEGIVMRGVQVGRDVGTVSRELQRQLGVTKRRAGLIARDQNNKATASLTRVRQLEVGLDEAIWIHSHGGRTPRPTHVKAGQNQTHFKIATGWYDPAERKYIQPGELINCRCVSRPIVKGFS